MRQPPATERSVKPRCCVGVLGLERGAGARGRRRRAARAPRRGRPRSIGSSTTISTASMALRARRGSRRRRRRTAPRRPASSRRLDAASPGPGHVGSLMLCALLGCRSSVALRIARSVRRRRRARRPRRTRRSRRSSPSSLPVHRTVSSPRASACSNAIAASRNSSSSARNRATITSVESASATSARKEQTRSRRSRSTDERGLLADADLRGVQVLQPDRRRDLGRHRPGGDHRQLLGRDAHDQLGQQARRTAARARPGAASCRPAVAIRSAKVKAMSLKARYCSSRANSRSRASMQGEVLLVLRAGLRQQPRRLEVEQRRRDEQELRRPGQVPLVVGPRRPDVGDELVGDLGEGDLGDVELVLADQAQQQVERPGEDVEVDLEGRRSRRVG